MRLELFRRNLSDFLIPMRSQQPLLIFASLLWLGLSSFLAYAQPTPPSPKEIVIYQIKSHAERHVKSNAGMKTEVVLDLYRENASGLTPLEISQIYEEEFIKQQEIRKSDELKSYLPHPGWIVSGILFLLIILREAFKKWGTDLVNLLGRRIYNRFAGNKLLRRTALKHYRTSLTVKYQKFSIPFQPKAFLDLREEFVPLRVIDSPYPDQLDAYQAVIDRKRLIVEGSTGAGKSMLLKYILLAYAEDRVSDWPDRPIPIMVELFRLNNSNTSLRQELINELRRNDFPHADTFIDQNLKQGRILLLLDALDEVLTDERRRVELEIKDFLDTYRGCRAVITCRTQAYDNELSNTVNQVLKVIDFNDHQIQQFLRLWEPRMAADRSSEQLVNTLKERPQIMALARNPLLLTMIAFSYTNETYPLPHSRAEFYQNAINLLLRQWHPERNQFHPSDKSRLLQELALYIQDSKTPKHLDSRSLPYEMIVGKIRELRTDFVMRADQQPEGLIKEIEERSGLLISIDNGMHYQFAHRSFQEYFAAEKLKGKPIDLAKRFRSDSEIWRETVKLWCGLSPNESTEILKTVFDVEPLTAFECLAEAQAVNDDLAERVINTFKPQLIQANSDDALAKVFGVVAASQRPRGESLREFLRDSLLTADNSILRQAAAKAISYTDLPQSASMLASYYHNWREVRAPLVRMGDLAVRDLASLVDSDLQRSTQIVKYINVKTLEEVTQQDFFDAKLVDDDKDFLEVDYFQAPDAMDDIQAVGTPRAAKVFVKLLWDSNITFAGSAAWRLAALLSQPDVEDFLHEYELPEGIKVRPPDWFRKSFGSNGDTSLVVIAGRVAYLLDKAPLESAPLPPLKIDPRLAMPICAEKLNNAVNLDRLDAGPTMGLAAVISAIIKLDNECDLTTTTSKNDRELEEARSYDPSATKRALSKVLRILAEHSGDPNFVALQKRLVDEFCAATHATQRWHYLFMSLRTNLQLDFLTKLIKGPTPTPDNCLESLTASNIYSNPVSVTH